MPDAVGGLHGFCGEAQCPPHYGTASRTSMKSARLLTVSKRDRRSRFIAACYSDQAWLF